MSVESRIRVRNLIVRRFACSLLAVAAVASSCTNQPLPESSEPAPSSGTPAPVASNSANPDPANLDDLHWYQVDTANDTQGGQVRTLITGSLGGAVGPEVRLGSLANSPDAEEFAWIAPQADGIFDGRVLLWERQGGSASLEVLELESGAISELLDVGDVVQTATASQDLASVYFVTADPESSTPTGLWSLTPAASPIPTQLPFEFPADQLTGAKRFRLVASADGRYLTIEQDDGLVRVLNTVSGEIDELGLGPVVGFTGGIVVAFGSQHADGSRPVQAYDVELGVQITLVDGVTSAQTPPGELVAFLLTDPDQPGAYAIGSIPAVGGAPTLVYQHESPEIGPLLARRDRTPLGAETPADHVLLVDSFVPFVGVGDLPPKPAVDSSFPLLLDLISGETVRIGPFSDSPS